MRTDGDKRLERRVIEAAEAALEARGFVTAIDVLGGLGWLPPSSEDAWRQGPHPLPRPRGHRTPRQDLWAMRHLRRWAASRGLRPSETAYVARTRDRRTLRFSKSGKPTVELAYRTHWVSPKLSERKRERLAERQSRPPDLVVVSPVREWTCSACGGTGDLLIMEEPGPLCLACAEMDHLVYLPAGDAALTRRARAASRLSAVVVRFSRARKRYERQGVLVEEAPWPTPSGSAWRTRRPGSASASAMRTAEGARTSSCGRASQPRSRGSSPAARRIAPTPSPVKRWPAAAAGSGEPRPDARSKRTPASVRGPRRSPPQTPPPT